MPPTIIYEGGNGNAFFAQQCNKKIELISLHIVTSVTHEFFLVLHSTLEKNV